jgi:hypothetical protein
MEKESDEEKIEEEMLAEPASLLHIVRINRMRLSMSDTEAEVDATQFRSSHEDEPPTETVRQRRETSPRRRGRVGDGSGRPT